MAEHGFFSEEQGGRRRLCDFIRENQLRILETWEREVLRHPYSQGLSRPLILDHLPQLLDRVAAQVETVHTGGDESLLEFPELHALERLDVGYDLEDVAHEYALLRTCILLLYTEHARRAEAEEAEMMLREVLRFNQTFDQALSTAVSRYARARARTLMALDRIAEAARGSEELDSFVPTLLRLMLESTESVDSVTLLLREGDTLRVRASVGLEADVEAGFSLKVGEGFAGKIAAERCPLELRSAATDPLVKSPALRAQGVLGIYGVPLLHEGEVIGVAHMGSRSAQEFSQEDKLLFRTMVSRATGLIVQAQLVARERAMREELAANEQLLRLLIDQSADAIIMADEQGVLRLFNAEAERQHGASRQEVSAPEWTLTFGLLSLEGQPLPLEETPLYRAVHGETVTEAHWKVQRPDGTVRILGGNAAPLRRPDGSLAGAVLIARDETERLQREAEQAETLALLDTLIATAPIGLAFLDRQHRVVRINRRLADMNGLSVEAVLGHSLREALPEQVDTVEPSIRHVFATGEPLMDKEVSSPGAPGPEGPQYWQVSYYPVRDARGVVRWVGTVVVDVSDSKRREEELRRTAEFRERFLGIVSHDLRNPLNAILLSANALLRSEELPARQLKAVRRITSSAERMARMISDLLDFTRGRLGGGIPISRQRLNLRHLCRHVLEELESGHPERWLRLEARGDLSGDWDADRLAQLIGNLGKNALDYSPEDKPVDFILRDEGEAVRIEIHNQGPPIPEELLPHIFEPFRRGEAGVESSSSGLGLGLFIVCQIAWAHGGTVSVRSSEEEGTTFTVRLPRSSGGAPASS